MDDQMHLSIFLRRTCYAECASAGKSYNEEMISQYFSDEMLISLESGGGKNRLVYTRMMRPCKRYGANKNY